MNLRLPLTDIAHECPKYPKFKTKRIRLFPQVRGFSDVYAVSYTRALVKVVAGVRMKCRNFAKLSCSGPALCVGSRMRRNVAYWLILGVVLACARAAVAEQLTNEDVRDMTHTIGFITGQKLSLLAIADKFPSLTPEIEIAKLEFDSKFGSAVIAINTRLKALDSRRWAETKDQMLKALTEKFSSRPFTKAQASEFVKTVRERAKGQIEGRVLQTLLMWTPSYQKNPELEFAEYRRKFVGKESDKSKGIRFQIEYPASWASLEADRPNIVKKFVSERGRGTEYALVMVNSLPPEALLSKREMEYAFSPTNIRDFLAPGQSIISERQITFDGLPGAMFVLRTTTDRMGHQISIRSINYLTIYQHKIVMLQFSTLDNDITFARFEPLFQLMANSAVILSQYE